jgi:hypothetical protein
MYLSSFSYFLRITYKKKKKLTISIRYSSKTVIYKKKSFIKYLCAVVLWTLLGRNNIYSIIEMVNKYCISNYLVHASLLADYCSSLLIYYYNFLLHSSDKVYLIISTYYKFTHNTIILSVILRRYILCICQMYRNLNFKII